MNIRNYYQNITSFKKCEIRNKQFYPNCYAEFSETTNLSNALRLIQEDSNFQQGITGDKKRLSKFVKDIENSESGGDFIPKITKLIGSGSSAIVFETENGDALKITKGNHFPLNRTPQEFDLPIIKKWKLKNTYVYLEEKLNQNGLEFGFSEMLIDKIKSLGYKNVDFSSLDFHQIGISKNGKLYLLDPECAVYKNIFFFF